MSHLSSGLTTSYLQDLGRRLMPQTFSGVVPADGLDAIFTHFDQDQYVICNILKASVPMPGHWVSIAYQKQHPDKLLYYDSLGFPPSLHPLIQRFLQRTGKRLFHYSQAIQSPFSIMCGYHCLAFLLHLDRRIPTGAFFSLYNRPGNDLQGNDDISLYFIKTCLLTSSG